MTAATAKPMMMCGHTANAVMVESDERIPCCAICAPEPASYTINPTPRSLEGRQAQCTCGKAVPSDDSGRLAFFQYRGPGMADPPCSVGRCFYVESVHQQINPRTGRPGVTDHAFVARTYEYDSFYCGCRGWD